MKYRNKTIVTKYVLVYIILTTIAFMTNHGTVVLLVGYRSTI